MSAATYITIGTLVFFVLCLLRLSAAARNQFLSAWRFTVKPQGCDTSEAGTHIKLEGLIRVGMPATTRSTFSAGAVLPALPKKPEKPLCLPAVLAVPAASNLVTVIEGAGKPTFLGSNSDRRSASDLSRNSISAGANQQQAKPSASARSAAPADYFTNTEENHPSTLLAEAGANGLRHSPDGVPPKGLGRPEDKPLMRNPMEPMICSRPTGSTASNNLRKPRWALKPGTIARLNEEVVK